MLTPTRRPTAPAPQKNALASTKNGHAPESERPSPAGRTPERQSPDWRPTLEQLLPDLRRIARIRAAGDPDLAADLLQHLAEDLFTHQTRRGGALDTRAYYLQRAWWKAGNYLSKARTYRRYVTLMPICLDPEGETIDLTELIPDPTATPEDQIIAAEHRAERLSRLTPAQHRIVDLLLAGYTRTEITRTLHLSPSSISQHLTRLRAQALIHD